MEQATAVTNSQPAVTRTPKLRAYAVTAYPYTIATIAVQGNKPGEFNHYHGVTKYNPNDGSLKSLVKQIQRRKGRTLTEEELGRVRVQEFDPNFGARVAAGRALRSYRDQTGEKLTMDDVEITLVADKNS